MKVAVKDLAGAEVARIDLNESVFGVPLNRGVVYQALLRQRANARQGNASTKTRGMVSGTTRKPWRQKHTGRARIGTRMSPLWRHGGVVFGPHPKDFSQRIPKKMRRLAIRCLLSNHQSEGTLSILLDFDLAEGKTREMAEVLQALDIEGSVLLVTRDPDGNVIRSAHNIPRVKTLPANNINTGDLLKYEHLIMTVDAVRRAEGLWSGDLVRRRAPGEERPERQDPPADLEMLRAPTPRRVAAKAAAPVAKPAPEPTPEPETAPATATPARPTRSRRARAETARTERAPVAEEAPAPKPRSRAKTAAAPAAEAKPATRAKASAATAAKTTIAAKTKAASKPKASAKTTAAKPAAKPRTRASTTAKKPPARRPRSTS